MDTIKPRLASCFALVFPSLQAEEIELATQSRVEAWDSAAMILLMSVIEDEFGMQLDMDSLTELDSFTRIHEYLANGCAQ